MKTVMLLLVLLGSYASGQTGGLIHSEPAASPIGVSTAPPFYSVDESFHVQIRDLEYEANEIEIEILTLQKRIEEDKAKEAEIWKQVSLAAAAYAEKKKIDPAKYDFDVKAVKFPQKKKP